MTLLGTLAGLAMALGAPLVYADQALSIARKRDSTGFSKDVCAVLLIANIARCFFWLGAPFEFVLLLQSILMIAAQVYLLHLLLKFRVGSYAHAAFTASSADSRRTSEPVRIFDAAAAPVANTPTTTADVPSTPRLVAQPPAHSLSTPPARGRGRYMPLVGLELPPAPTLGLDEDDDDEAPVRRTWLATLKASIKRGEGTRADGSQGNRPFGFWTWTSLSPYLMFLIGFCLLLGLLHFALGSWNQTYVSLLGYFALGLESTLPIPQAIANQRRRSLSGFRLSVLAGWVLGDSFKTAYFFLQGSPLQFTVCALFQLSVDAVICLQAYLFREQTAADDEAAAIAQAEALAAREAEQGDIRDGPTHVIEEERAPSTGNARKAGKAKPKPHKDTRDEIEADSSEDETR